MTREQRKHVRLIIGVVAVVLVVLLAGLVGRYYLNRIDEGVARRRAAAATALERQHQADLQLCEVAMNVNAQRFLDIITKLGALTPPSTDPAEVDIREQAGAILAEGLAPIDCEVFVATGEAVPLGASR